jgi:hypothetical protein
VNSPKQSIKLFWVIVRQVGSPSYLQYRELLITSNSYFLAPGKCPVSIQNLFENPLSFTLLHFLASQLKTFSHTIKCIERQGTTVIEVKNEINELLDKLNCRKTDFLQLL